MFIIQFCVQVALVSCPFVLLIFALTPHLNLRSQFAFSHFWLNAYWLVAHLHDTQRQRISRRRTKKRSCLLNVNYVSVRPFAIRTGRVVCLHLLNFPLLYLQKHVYVSSIRRQTNWPDVE
jgi:hypothetical protein